MSACPSRQQLELYLDERLPEAERQLVEAHVRACRACQQALEKAAALGEPKALRGLHLRHAAPGHEPGGDVLIRIARAGFPGADVTSRSDVIVAVTDAYNSPGSEMPAMSADVAPSDQPTRQASPFETDDEAAMILKPGTILGQYRILDRLGAGGMGQVYKAVHTTMDRVVALKVIAPQLLRDARARARFQQEVRAAAKLHHPNIVLAFDAAESNGLSFLVMEHVEGTTLSTLVSEQGLPPVPLACEMIRQAALGLQHARDKGMVHRDIKPGNLMVSAQQTAGGGAIVQVPQPGGTLPGWPSAPLVKILDFGVARLRALGADGEPLKMQTLTQEGCVVGTPEFMSPEQACDSRSVDIRSDIYSLGCTLYYLLTGRPPFSGVTALETMVQHLKQPLPPVDQLRPGLAPGIAAVVHKMLAKKAEERYQSPAEVAEALQPWTGEFASSVAPDVRLAQRGLTPTAPDAPEIARTPAESPSAANSAPPSEPTPAGARSHTTTFLALLLLFVVSMIAFWLVSPYLNFASKTQSDERPGPGDGDATEPDDLRVNLLRMRMMRVPRGQFHRSFGPADSDAKFEYDLEVSATEVTRGQFALFVKETKYVTLAEKSDAKQLGSFVPDADGGEWKAGVTWKQDGVDSDDLPVTCVSWEDAVAFCNWLSKLEGEELCYVQSGEIWGCRFQLNGYRLPTEAEWENAARAGSAKLLPSEPAGLGEFGWLRPKSEGKPHPVGRLNPNSRALQDVWGNVWEWCWDWYTEHPDDPNGPASGTLRTVWGGGWNDTPEELARKPRKGLTPDYRATDLGFRVVRKIGSR